MSNSTTNLDLIASSQAQKEITANAIFDAASPAMIFGRRASTTAGLSWGYYGGQFTKLDGSNITITNGVLSLTASVTNYVEVSSAGVVSVNPTAFTTGRTPLYTVVAGASTVTSYTDNRDGTQGNFLAGGAAGTVTDIAASNGVRTTSGSDITAAGAIEGDLPINAQTGTSYALVTGDRGKAVTFNNASAIAASIQAAGSTGFPSGWYAELVNLGNGVVTLTPTTSAVDGAASITLAVHDNICLFSDGTNYFTLRGRISGAGSGTVTSVALSTPGVIFNVSGSPVTSSGTLALSLINQAASTVLAGPTSGGSAAPSFRALAIGDLSFADTDTTLAANSDARLATQKAVKAYVDNVVTGGAAGVMVFKGAIDCSANPNYPAANAGAVYKVSVAGKLGGAAGVAVEVGDTAYCTAAAATGDQATVGASWNVVQENIDGAVTGPASATDSHVAMFNGATGKIVKDSGLTLAGTNTGDETATTTGTLIHGASAKTTLVDADEMDLTDSATSFVMKKITWANVKAAIFSAWGALISTATAKTTPVDADAFAMMDSAASNATKGLTWANLKATLKTYFDTLYAPLSQPFDLTAFYPSIPTASAKVTRIPIARAVTFAANFAGSYFTASANATGTTVFDVQKNGSSIGSISIAASGTTATFTTTSGTSKSFAAGDVLMIVAPASPDATLADPGFVIVGAR